MRIFVDKKEVSILIKALEMYSENNSIEQQLVKKLLVKIDDCVKLQVSQHNSK